jgi:hypothetical protein
MLRPLLLAASLALTALIVWAFGQAPFFASFGRIAAEPWGLVSLADLYLGFLCAAVVIALAERARPVVAAAWIVGVFFLGNVVTAIWLALALPRISAALRPPPTG